MDASVVDKRFLRVNKRLGVLFGIWPYQDYRKKVIVRAMIFILMTSCYITQYSRVIILHSVEIVLKDYPHLITGVGTMLKWGNYLINEPKLKILLGSIYEDWKTITLEDECEIMTKYAQRGVLYVTLYVMHLAIVGCLYLFMPFVPRILDLVAPLNGSRERILVYPAYYFGLERQYYYYVIAHMMLILSVLVLIYCACDANYIYAVQHACGLLAVSGHRFQHACNELADIGQKDVNMTYKNICNSVRGHFHALEYIKVIETTHDICLFISVGLLMTSVSILLLKISEDNHDKEWCMNSMYLFGHLFHMLFLTVQGQFVLNSYDSLYDKICQATWYNSSYKNQRLYVLALRRMVDPPLLTAGGFVQLNLRTFVQTVKASVSYYTVMQSK